MAGIQLSRTLYNKLREGRTSKGSPVKFSRRRREAPLFAYSPSFPPQNNNSILYYISFSHVWVYPLHRLFTGWIHNDLFSKVYKRGKFHIFSSKNRDKILPYVFVPSFTSNIIRCNRINNVSIGYQMVFDGNTWFFIKYFLIIFF